MKIATEPRRTDEHVFDAFLISDDAGNWYIQVSISKKSNTPHIHSNLVGVRAFANEQTEIKCVPENPETLIEFGKSGCTTARATFRLETSDPDSVTHLEILFGGQTHHIVLTEYVPPKVH